MGFPANGRFSGGEGAGAGHRGFILVYLLSVLVVDAAGPLHDLRTWRTANFKLEAAVSNNLHLETQDPNKNKT